MQQKSSMPRRGALRLLAGAALLPLALTGCVVHEHRRARVVEVVPAPRAKVVEKTVIVRRR